MTTLALIQTFVQEYAETIAQVLDVDVTIVDEDCVRIGGTGPYLRNVGERVPQGSFFGQILETGQPGIIDSVQNEVACQTCTAQDQCQELVTMGIPIFNKGTPVGVIGILAFSPEQKSRIMNRSDKLWGFLNHMSSLLESKLQLLETNQRLEKQVREALESLNKKYSFGAMIGRSTGFQHLIEAAKQVSQSQSTVLIRGESGTGKELLARAIHGQSKRSQAPFIVVNCPSIPESLLESELFGYEGGSFTGAKKEGKMGKFELAHQGTIFLDEIGDLPLSLQPKLLRVIQERTIERIGGKDTLPVDVRIIAATNQSLEEMVGQGKFREDLYYRLNVIPLFIPPLRQRTEDIELYLEHFILKYSSLLEKKGLRIHPEVLHWLKNYAWPGNVRQLENVVEYMVNMAKNEEIDFLDLPYNLVEKEKALLRNTLGLEEQVAEFEKHLLESSLQPGAHLETKRQVAHDLKISLATLYRKLEKYGLM